MVFPRGVALAQGLDPFPLLGKVEDQKQAAHVVHQRANHGFFRLPDALRVAQRARELAGDQGLPQLDGSLRAIDGHAGKIVQQLDPEREVADRFYPQDQDGARHRRDFPPERAIHGGVGQAYDLLRQAEIGEHARGHLTDAGVAVQRLEDVVDAELQRGEIPLLRHAVP